MKKVINPNVFLNSLKNPHNLIREASFKMIPILKSLPLKMMAWKIDIPKKYALDWVTVNVNVPHDKQSSISVEKMHRVRNDIYSDFPQFWQQYTFQKPCLQYVKMINSRNSIANHQIKIDISGKYFGQNILNVDGTFDSTNNIEDDVSQLVADLIPIQEFIYQKFLHWNVKINKKEFKTTTNNNNEIKKVKQILDDNFKIALPDLHISRIDICRNYYSKNDNMKSLVWMGKQPGRLHAQPMIHLLTGEATGWLIGTRTNKGLDGLIKLKIYDKDQDLDEMSKNTALLRFGSSSFLRKEWNIKRKFFTNSLKLSTLNDFYLFTRNEHNILEMLKRMRLNKDVFINTDHKRYRALHDKEVRKTLASSSLSIWKINKIYQRRMFVVHNRVSKKNVIKGKVWNPIPQLDGIFANHIQNIDIQNMKELIQRLQFSLDTKIQTGLTMYEKKVIEQKSEEVKIYTKHKSLLWQYSEETTKKVINNEMQRLRDIQKEEKTKQYNNNKKRFTI